MGFVIDGLLLILVIAALVVFISYFGSRMVRSSVHSAMTLTNQTERSIAGALVFLAIVVGVTIVLTAVVVSAVNHC